MKFGIEMTEGDLNSEIGRKLLYYLLKNEGEYETGDYYFDMLLQEREVTDGENIRKYKVLVLETNNRIPMME